MITHPILSAAASHGVRLGLERLADFFGTLGHPERAFPAVHVAGTNGKGSVTRMVAAVFDAAGRRAGLTISPHLERVNERIVVGGVEISDDELDTTLRALDAARAAWAAGQGPILPADRALTYFELTTAAAFWWFAQQKVEVAAVEVGLGGRLDATNLVRSVSTAIVSIGLDHMEQLGPDEPSIAREKAGIFKPGVPAILGPLRPAARAVAAAVAAERGCPLWEPGRTYAVTPQPDGRFDWHGPGGTLTGLHTRLAGAHQVDNAGVAIALLRALPDPLRPSDDAIRAGLAAATNPGRLERLGPRLLVDCAHNADGAAVLADWLRATPPPPGGRTLLLGVSADKDLAAIAPAIAPHVDRIFTTACAHPRALDPVALQARLAALGIPAAALGPIEDALPAALDAPGEVLVAGSVFLAGAVRTLVGAP